MYERCFCSRPDGVDPNLDHPEDDLKDAEDAHASEEAERSTCKMIHIKKKRICLPYNVEIFTDCSYLCSECDFPRADDFSHAANGNLKKNPLGMNANWPKKNTK